MNWRDKVREMIKFRAEQQMLHQINTKIFQLEEEKATQAGDQKMKLKKQYKNTQVMKRCKEKLNNYYINDFNFNLLINFMDNKLS